MENKSKLNTVLLIIIIILLAGGLVYFFFSNSKQKEPYLLNDVNIEKKENKNNQSPINNNDNFDWNTLSETDLFNIVLKETKIKYLVPESGFRLSEIIDLTGDGQKEAVVTGDGGNNDISFILFRNEDGSIFVAKRKDKDGNTDFASLLSVGRVAFQEKYVLLPEMNGYYTTSLVIDDSKDNSVSSYFKCNTNGVRAYTWNSNLELFEWNQELTTKYTLQVCK